DEAELRRDVDDRSAAGAAHGRDHALGPEEHALGIDVHHAVPVLDRGVLDPTSTTDAGVVDEDVQLAEAALGHADRLLPVGLARDVETREGGLAALRLDVRFDAASFGFEDVADDYLRALPCEHQRFGGAHPACRPADQRDLAGQSHGDPA